MIIKPSKMKTMRITFLMALLVLLAGKSVSAQDKAAEIDKVMQYASDINAFSGVLMVTEKGKVIYNKGFGYADIENKKSITDNTLFNLCSITKQFTAMCIMMLKEQGKLSYEDKLVKYVPNLPYDVTIRQMMNHTSGLPDYFNMLAQGAWTGEKSPDNNDIIGLLVKNNPPMLFAPGEKHLYNNTGYILLATIIEKISGMSYADFLTKNIFQPVGMTRTLVYMPYISKVHPDNVAKPYVYDYVKSKLVRTETYEPYRIQVTSFDGTLGDGGIHSCSNDMFKWNEALKTEKLVKKATMEEAFTNGTLKDGKPITSPLAGPLGGGYGFGWFTVNDPVNGKIALHTGGWPGFKQAFIRYLDKDRSILVLRNNEVPFGSIQKTLENILDGKPYVMPQPSVAYALGQIAIKGTAADIRKKFEEIKGISPVKEEDINLAGYGIMERGKLPEALEIMKINAELFPKSANVFDSLGELYLKNGDKQNAKLNYTKSLEINPANNDAKKVLEKL
jgi:CubicO group peptidase (beta-lactamase class C family)